MLMTLMERGAKVRFLIVGKKSLPDDELDGGGSALGETNTQRTGFMYVYVGIDGSLDPFWWGVQYLGDCIVYMFEKLTFCIRLERG